MKSIVRVNAHMPETATEHATALLPLLGGLGMVWTSTEAPPSFHSLLYPREGSLKPIRQSLRSPELLCHHFVL